MSNDNDSFNYSNNSAFRHNESIFNTVKFWFYLVFLIPSIICSIFSLYYLLWNRTLRHALHNHAIIIFLSIGLTYEVTIYPWMLNYYYKQGLWKRTHLFCTVWIFIDWGLYYTQTTLFAWATMERHILIFHDNIGLLIRVYRQKHRVGQSLTWRKHWKMTVQLLFVSVNYLIFSLPLTLMSVFYLLGVPLYVTAKFTQYASFLYYCTMLLFPSVATLFLPQLKDERKNMLRLRGRTRAVVPIR
ncbi:unnamed protein product [Rotaria sp. Silwood1]|nr:unnamed protein product [Rotaria sp. Silwood1]CAF3346563.1 unnamed protein product [Rotaria sp. Silwood1]